MNLGLKYELLLRQEITHFQVPYWYEGWDEIEIAPVKKVFSIFSEFEFSKKINYYVQGGRTSLGRYLENCHKTLLDQPQRANECVEDACLFHGIGLRHTQNGASTVENYCGYESVSAYYLLSAKEFLDRTVEEQLYTALLIQWHNSLNNKTMKDKAIKLLSPQMIKDIELIQLCIEKTK